MQALVAFDYKTHTDPKVSNHDPELSGATADNGDAIDCNKYSGPIYGLACVAEATGSPDSFTVTAKLQESDDGSTSWADLSNQDTATITADKGAAVVRGHRTKRYVRMVLTPAFVSGTTPKIHASGVILGQKQNTED